MKNNEKIKGILLCLLISIPIWIIVSLFKPLEIIGAPVIGIISGMLISIVIKDKSQYTKGIHFVSKKILQYAVILLGFGLNLVTIAKVGVFSLPVIVSTILSSFLMAYIIHKTLKVTNKVSILIGVGSSICGGSAIAATAPVIDAKDDEIAQSVSVIFLFNVLAALLFPALGNLLGFSNNDFGLFAGTAINDTSSVTAAASTWDNIHGTNGAVLEYATIVKLTRTLAIIPITLTLAYFRIKMEKKKNLETKKPVNIKNIFPIFILYFILASIITTLISMVFKGETLTFFSNIFSELKVVSKFFILMAMTAIGLNSDIVSLIKKGGKPVIMGFFCWLIITFVSIIYLKVLL